MTVSTATVPVPALAQPVAQRITKAKRRKREARASKRPVKTRNPAAKQKKEDAQQPREVREGKKPGIYVHILRLLRKASKAQPLTDAKCFEALRRIKALKDRFATEEGAHGVEITMRDAYRRTLITRMGWPVKNDGKPGAARGFWLSPDAKSKNPRQQAKWEKLNSKKAK